MFGIPLSGLNACQKYLDVTSNNISNANSYGFKKSRAEFADIYSSNVFTSTKTATGMGVLTSTVAQQFSQGSLTGDTGNNLDMAIEGNGFFVLAPSANATNAQATESRTYTRNGAFEINADGYVVTSSGDYLQFYDINDQDEATNLTVSATHALQIPSTTGAPKASSKLSIGVNLPANAKAKTITEFDPTDSTTYNAATSQTIHDSLGGAHTLTYYFIKNDKLAPDGDGYTTWNVIAMVDGTEDSNLVDLYDADKGAITTDKARFTVANGSSPLNGKTIHGATLVFNTSGQVQDAKCIPEKGNFYLANAAGSYKTDTGHTLVNAMGGGVDDSQGVSVTMASTQYGSSSFNVSVTPTDDGYSTGLLTNISVNDDGVMLATYSNVRQVHLAKVAMANFINPQGLTKIGDTQWQESIDSGEPMAIQANVGVAGAIKGANLEQSNVDLTASLVDLIIAQRTYQANCQALQTQNTMMDAIMSVR